MLVTLLFTLGVSAAVVMAVALVMWLDIPFRRDERLARRRVAAGRFRPPFARGEELLDWTRTAAAQVVRKHLARRKTTSPVELVAELHQCAMQAMLPVLPNDEINRTVTCGEAGQGPIGVTAPEALAIAAYLRRNLSPGERLRIHDRALENARKIAHGESAAGGEQTPCPLQGKDHVCRVYPIRPLHCRPLHAAIIARQFGLETSGADGSIPPWAAHLQTVEQGVEEGLVSELTSAGLDGNVYELNSALVAALDAPDAAQRWARGADVFGQCTRHR